ncbi:hypothetical protein [Neptuniibacter sp. CAU 1671]|uniref:hypothetical protein n=1 Tax=Neptuniibacter sp. CAU 1671 TaxID=3032593 RepID=UPI0023D98493|nr:hypothetical protein [Neptuniibacter sp. CAU 1671]MDF2182038.1 hypothetical protein [Neptuniibacter sp. CAU 1671]
MESLEIKKLSAGSVYKLIFIGSLLGMLLVTLFFGVLGVLGMETVSWNGQPVTGFKALLVAPMIGVMMSALFTAIFGSVIVLGLWLYAFYRPLTLYVFENKDQT